MPAGAPGHQQLNDDLKQVQEALIQAGGEKTQKPPTEDNLYAGKGQKVKLYNDNYTMGAFDDLPDRPPEDSLPRLTQTDFLPPASTDIIPLDFQVDPNLPTYVREQNVEFLVLMKSGSGEWTFPKAEVLKKIYDDAREIEHDEILDVVLWTRIEKDSTVASIMLSTVNIELCLLYTSPSPRD